MHNINKYGCEHSYINQAAKNVLPKNKQHFEDD